MMMIGRSLLLLLGGDGGALMVVLVALLMCSRMVILPTHADSCQDGLTQDYFNNITTLRVGTFNTEWLFDGVNERESNRWFNDSVGATEHLMNITRVIGELNVDVLALIEVEDCTILGRLTDALGPEWGGYLRQGKDTATGQDVALITNSTVITPATAAERVDNRIDYPIPGSVCGYSGSADTTVSKHLYTTFRIADRNITVIVVHFIAFPTVSTRCAQREAQATVIRDLANSFRQQNHSLIIMGDFNDFENEALDIADNEPTSMVMNILKDINNDGNEDMINVISLLPKEDRYTSYYDANSNGRDDGDQERSAIDHILVSLDIYQYVVDVKVFQELYKAAVISDHWPVVVDFDFTPPLCCFNPSSAAVHTPSLLLIVAFASIVVFFTGSYHL
eukprot:m.135951 g.135951  ORF g.135951 m.135951 type:complete len:393 (+) comp10323_c0_seq1:81-1259(+)